MRYMALYALILKINPFIFIFSFKYDVSAMQMLDMMFINTTFQLYLIILGGAVCKRIFNWLFHLNKSIYKTVKNCLLYNRVIL